MGVDCGGVCVVYGHSCGDGEPCGRDLDCHDASFCHADAVAEPSARETLSWSRAASSQCVADPEFSDDQERNPLFGSAAVEWTLQQGYYVIEGHTDTSECYPLEEAKLMCLAASDCHAIATQSNVCSGQYRVTHGGPTLTYYNDWATYDLHAYSLSRELTLDECKARCADTDNVDAHGRGCVAIEWSHSASLYNFVDVAVAMGSWHLTIRGNRYQHDVLSVEPLTGCSGDEFEVDVQPSNWCFENYGLANQFVLKQRKCGAVGFSFVSGLTCENQLVTITEISFEPPAAAVAADAEDRASCALAWGCDAKQAWQGGDLYVLARSSLAASRKKCVSCSNGNQVTLLRNTRLLARSLVLYIYVYTFARTHTRRC
eukprot:SAG11_NODE_1469_length_4850_cov_2.659651_4_plen_372_part_00